MSLSKIVSLLERMGYSDARISTCITCIVDNAPGERAAAAPVAERPVSKTTAWRMKKAAEAGSASVPNAFQTVPSGTAETFHGTENGTGGTFHGTTHARALPLSSPVSSEKEERNQTHARRGTFHGTKGGTQGGTDGGTQSGTTNGTISGTELNQTNDRIRETRALLVKAYESRDLAVPGDLLGLCLNNSPLWKLAHQKPEHVAEAIEGFFKCPKVAGKWPLPFLASNLEEYRKLAKTSATLSTAGRPSTLADYEHLALNREEQLKRGEKTRPPNPEHLQSAKAKMAAAQQAMAS
jgi:hypothetical protein